MMIRLLDIFFSLIGLVLLAPFFLVICLLIVLSSKGRAFFVQERIGKDGKPFRLIKFRSMRLSKVSQSLITVGNDSRITPIGRFLRKFKLDELPQLINVLKGEMSIVGPRPEVGKYVDLYSASQRKVLSVKPGLTDYASIVFIDESELLVLSSNPEEAYINEILPKKLELNLKYVNNKTLANYFRIIALTAKSIIVR